MEIVLLSLLSGTFGRMGGASKEGNWYDFLLDTKWRDIGCSLILIVALTLMYGWHPWQYALVFGLTWASFTTYWDSVFGYDNLWFSGFCVGLAMLPVIFIDINLFWFVMGRAVVLCVVWGCLNEFLPQDGVLCWRRDVVEEFTRYAVSL